MALSKQKGPLLTTTEVGDAQALPLVWRAKSGTVTTEQKVPLDVTPTALTGAATADAVVFSETAQKETDERLKTVVMLTAPTQTITEHVRTQDAQLGTRVRSLVAEGAALPTILATTTESTQQAFGNGLAEQDVTTVDSVYPATRKKDEGEAMFLNEKIQHFFVGYKKEISGTTSAGTTATPTTLADPTTAAALATGIGVIESLAEQVDATKVRVTDTTITASSLGTLSGYRYDETSGLLVPTVEQVVAAGTSGLALQSDGTYAEITPINARFSIKKTNSAVGWSSRSYTAYEFVALPRVLLSFNAITFVDKAHRDAYQNDSPETETLADGSTPTYPEYQNPYHINPGGNILKASINTVLRDYSRQYAVTVQEYFSNAPFSLSGATLLQPEDFSWDTPFTSGSVPSCLHDAVTITASTGTTHPTYAYVACVYSIAATTPVALSGLTIVIQDTQMPYLGGWKRTKKSITIP